MQEMCKLDLHPCELVTGLPHDGCGLQMAMRKAKRLTQDGPSGPPHKPVSKPQVRSLPPLLVYLSS